MSVTLTRGGGSTPSGEGAWDGSGSLSLTGTNTFQINDLGQGDYELAGALPFVGNVEILTANRTLTEDDNGKIFVVNAVDLVAQLPALSGLSSQVSYFFQVLTISATTGFSVSPNASDNINGGSDDADLVNTAATDAVGDAVMVTSGGAASWVATVIKGTWA